MIITLIIIQMIIVIIERANNNHHLPLNIYIIDLVNNVYDYLLIFIQIINVLFNSRK